MTCASKTLYLLVALVALPGCGGTSGSGSGPHSGNGGGGPSAWFVKAEGIAQASISTDYVHKAGSIGAIVEVSCPDGSWSKAFGLADANGTPMAPDMQFRIASITKTFTAMGVLELIDAGRLHNEDLISKYIPDHPAKIPAGDWDKITIEELANHTSGLGSIANYGNAPWDFGNLLPLIPVDNSPGKTYEYSNSNYIVLGDLIQVLTGNDPADFFQQEFLGPLNLLHTSVATSGTQPALICQGYNGTSNVTTANPTWSSCAGEMVSNAQDLTRWIRAVFHDRLLSPATQNILLEEFTPTDQTGFGVQEYNHWLGHTGRIAGYSSACFYNPYLDASVVVMVNRMDSTDEKNNIAREFFVLDDVIKAFFPGFPIDKSSED